MREQTVLQPHNEYMGEFESFAGMHGDERHGIACVFLLFCAVAVQRDIFEEVLQSLGWLIAHAIHRGEQFLQVAHPAFGIFRIFFQAPQLGKIAGFIQKAFRPSLQH